MFTPPTPSAPTKQQFETRMALAFSMLFLAPGVHVPYFPIWLEAKGFGPGDIAIILSAPMFLRIVTTPIITTWADQAGDRATVFTGLVAASALLSLSYFLPPTYTIVLLVSLLLAIPWTPQSPLADSVALSGVRRYGCSYTKMRIWGSVSYLVGNLIGGVVLSAAGAGSVPVLMFAGLIALLGVSFLIPRIGPPRRASQPALSVLQSGKSFGRRFAYLVIGAGLIAGSHSFINSFMSIHWAAIGFSGTLIGLLWAWSVAAEVLIFWAFPRLFGAKSATTILLIAACSAIVRWTVYPLIEPLGLGVTGFFAVQTLHAFSIGLMLIGVQKLIAEEVAEERTGAAQGVAYLANGLSIAAITLVSGPLYAAFGPNGNVPMIAVAGIAAVCIWLGAHQPQRSDVGGDTREPV